MKGIVSFYGRSDCKESEFQRQQLRDAGYVVQFIDILAKQWDRSALMKFFSGQSIHDCIQPDEAIKYEIKPDSLNEEELLQTMTQKPALIQTPLLFFRGEFACSFDSPLVARLLNEPQMS